MSSKKDTGNLDYETRKRISHSRNVDIKICLRCNARNAIRAKRCRKCGYPRLRLKNRWETNIHLKP